MSTPGVIPLVWQQSGNQRQECFFVRVKNMPKQMTRDDFIAKSRQVHGDRYDYSNVKYTNNRIPVEIICPQHGSFWQTPHDHLGHKGHGCPICANEQRSKVQRRSHDSFVQESKSIHASKYDYSKIKYRGNKIKVEIVCPKHGSFWQVPSNHLRGAGCPKCGKEKGAQTRIRTQDSFIKGCMAVFGNRYNYSEVMYNGDKFRVKIICHEHGAFWARPHDFLKGHGCPGCGKNQASIKNTKKQDVFIQEARRIHGDMYDYSKVVYRRGKVKVEIICSQHGSFWQTPGNHVGQGQGCPKCSASQGEQRILYLLKSWKVHFVHQKSFSVLREKRMLRFDFYFRIGKLQFLVEYDGPHHFKDLEFYGGRENLKETQRRDAIKAKFAQDHNFILIRIPYTEYRHIETILKTSIELHTGTPFRPITRTTRIHNPKQITPFQGSQLSLL
jgi:hypothetical protein